MASIVKRKKKFSVVYTYIDDNGNKRQRWETFETNAEAKKRKAHNVTIASTENIQMISDEGYVGLDKVLEKYRADLDISE